MELKNAAKKLQERATADAIASTATRRNNSPFEGNKLWGGSITEFNEDLEADDGEGDLCFDFGRCLGVDEDILGFELIDTNNIFFLFQRIQRERKLNRKEKREDIRL